MVKQDCDGYGAMNVRINMPITGQVSGVSSEECSYGRNYNVTIMLATVSGVQAI